MIEPLGEHGHEAVAVDLPCDDPDAGLDAYADAIAAAVPAEAEDVVLVGHSLGGLPLSLVATRRPVGAIVYLSAFIPLPGQSMADQFGASPEPILLMEGGRESDELGRSFWKDPAVTARVLYPDLDAADAEWAFSRLRPQAQLSQTEQHPTGLPEVRSVSIVGSQDRALNPDWSRRVTRERLGHRAHRDRGRALLDDHPPGAARRDAQRGHGYGLHPAARAAVAGDARPTINGIGTLKPGPDRVDLKRDASARQAFSLGRRVCGGGRPARLRGQWGWR